MKHLTLLAVVAAAACKGSESGSICGSGTHVENGTCVITLSCGAGTHQDGARCVPDSSSGLVCAVGTHQFGNACVPDEVCGAGSHNDGGACMPDVVCGNGAHVDGGACVANSICGAGSHVDGGACVADSVCVSGSHVENGQCAPDVVCGTGTHASLGECVPDASGGATYDVRMLAQDITADGYSKVPVRVFGTNADGTPATGAVVLDTTLSGAGTFSATSFSVPTMGRDLFLTPCSAAAPGCSGTFQITVALGSAPNTPIASSWPLTLQAPAGVGSATPCLVGGNVVFYDGNSYVYSGTETITSGTFTANASSTFVGIHVTPSNSSQGLWWDLEFDSSQLGQPLAAQVYQDAMRYPFASPGHPGFDVSGDGRGCNSVTGKFQIEDLQVSGATVNSFTATFEHHCEGGAPALRGCVHFGP